MTVWLRLIAALLIAAGCVAPAAAPASDSRAGASSTSSTVPAASDETWPPFAVGGDLPTGLSLSAKGYTVTLRNDGAAAVWPESRPEGWTGAPWRRTDELATTPMGGSAVGPGDATSWTLDLRAGVRRVALRLWPSPEPAATP